MLITFTVVIFGALGIAFLSLVMRMIQYDGRVLPAVAVGLVILVGAVIAVVAAKFRASARSRWERWYRLDSFASANGMVFSPRGSAPQYPGAIFSAGHSRQSLDHLRSTSGRFLDYGNYRYVTGSGKNKSTHNWGFLALQLDRSLPHMVLDSRANNGLFGVSNLPAAFRKEQVLSLEGDFNNHFTLYCPQAYERDALYVFTPDLMALLIDNAAPFDVEIVDKWMFVYSAKPFVMLKPAVHQRLLSIVDTVGAKTLTQTDRYSDERVQNFTANLVAPHGQRLKRRVPIVSIAIGILVAVGFFVFPLVTALLAVEGL
ncbi:hypothetical protein QMG83_05985 [Salinibacterium sp. G-O1]|uniref:hypothetical protein n=1 Tax=Salinibacterium sp. G-O1 TaxID=3046208 RepID=UPI0024B8F22D|nr:hypothetical protein [Salinibacterium sp. G-O1]MDJ0334770.1 hypothetical protein [Salinibacterium sp. G-O1]